MTWVSIGVAVWLLVAAGMGVVLGRAARDRTCGGLAFCATGDGVLRCVEPIGHPLPHRDRTGATWGPAEKPKTAHS